ncbi:MAG: DUF2478 domain-containing protein [Paracoccus sp. (in: a-proteobacteria)]|nr:DUF2478 domain-containing protein [Paracoccus sp. (in: a-proteobacteria)]
MLAYIDVEKEPLGLLFLGDLARSLTADGIKVAGAVRTPGEKGLARRDMRLSILRDAGPEVVISQDLGPGATGCRLDPGALEQAAHRAVLAMPGAELVIVNKFGKQEAFGRGMCSLIAAAVEAGLPVLTCVDRPQRADFEAFAGEFATRITAAEAEIWCRDAIRRDAA